MPVERIDTDQREHLARSGEIGGNRFARSLLVGGRHRIFEVVGHPGLEIEDDRIGARRRCFRKAFGTVAGDKEKGSEAHQTFFLLISADRSH